MAQARRRSIASCRGAIGGEGGREAGAVFAGAAGAVAELGLSADGAEALIALSACWQGPERLCALCWRHASAAEPPVGTLEQ
jgi:hypothetical protein